MTYRSLTQSRARAHIFAVADTGGMTPSRRHPLAGGEIERFNDSFTRCVGDGRFLERFYELFLGASDEVRNKFRKTDFGKQRRMVHASLLMLMLAADGRPEGRLHLARIADLHSKRQLDIPPHLYDLWLDCLMQAVRECDREWTPETEDVWRRMMEQGIAEMKAHYDPGARPR